MSLLLRKTFRKDTNFVIPVRLLNESSSLLIALAEFCSREAAAIPAACCLSGVRAPAYCWLAANSNCRNLKDLLPDSTFFGKLSTFFCKISNLFGRCGTTLGGFSTSFGRCGTPLGGFNTSFGRCGTSFGRCGTSILAGATPQFWRYIKTKNAKLTLTS